MIQFAYHEKLATQKKEGSLKMVWLRKQEIHLQWCALKNYGENFYSEFRKNGTHPPLINVRNVFFPGHF